MKTFLYLTVLASLISLGGCSIFGEKIAGEVANAIDEYCNEPQNAREVYRDSINNELAADGHSIIVVCAGDTVQ